MRKLVIETCRLQGPLKAALVCGVRQASTSQPLSSPATLSRRQVVEKEQEAPSIREIRRQVYIHADTVYAQPFTAFDPSRRHTVDVGLQKSVIPIVSGPEYRDFYFSSDNQLRIGMLLEELDLISTWCAYKHNQDPSVPMCSPGGSHTMGAVTARVDRIDIPDGVTIRDDRDIYTAGFVTWSGSSSMEITIHYQQEDPESKKLRTVLTAKCVMVIISPDFKPSQNTRLELLSDDEHRLFRQGEEAKHARIARDKVAVTAGVLPTQEELSLLHDLQKRVVRPGVTLVDTDDLPPDHVWMERATHSRSHVCTVNEINCHGLVFGGFLMNHAYDTAYANACEFAGHGNLRLVGSTNNLFFKPVELGTTLTSASQVCFAYGKYVQLFVVQSSKNAKKNTDDVTCTFNLTFEANEEVPQIVPKTFPESLRFLNSRRELNYALTRKEGSRDNRLIA